MLLIYYYIYYYCNTAIYYTNMITFAVILINLPLSLAQIEPITERKQCYLTHYNTNYTISIQPDESLYVSDCFRCHCSTKLSVSCYKRESKSVEQVYCRNCSIIPLDLRCKRDSYIFCWDRINKEERYIGETWDILMCVRCFCSQFGTAACLVTSTSYISISSCSSHYKCILMNSNNGNISCEYCTDMGRVYLLKKEWRYGEIICSCIGHQRVICHSRLKRIDIFLFHPMNICSNCTQVKAAYQKYLLEESGKCLVSETIHMFVVFVFFCIILHIILFHRMQIRRNIF